MKPGELYQLSPMADKFPHVQALFPYMKGGDVLIIKSKVTKIHASKKEYYVELVDFLYNGKVYTESFQNFKDHAIYIGRSEDLKNV